MADLVLADRQTATAVMSRIREFQRVVREQLHEGTDYGVIPGTNAKPTLLKPGAEKIVLLTGLRSEFEIVDSTRDWEDGFFQYLVRCRLYRPAEDGGRELITEGLGSANTREGRYRNHDSYALDNTVLKMAEKRALVDAALHVGALSDLFTQDLEDLEEVIEDHPRLRADAKEVER